MRNIIFGDIFQPQDIENKSIEDLINELVSNFKKEKLQSLKQRKNIKEFVGNIIITMDSE